MHIIQYIKCNGFAQSETLALVKPLRGFWGFVIIYPVILTGLLLCIRLRRKGSVKNLIVFYHVNYSKNRKAVS